MSSKWNGMVVMVFGVALLCGLPGCTPRGAGKNAAPELPRDDSAPSQSPPLQPASRIHRRGR